MVILLPYKPSSRKSMVEQEFLQDPNGWFSAGGGGAGLLLELMRSGPAWQEHGGAGVTSPVLHASPSG